MSGDFPGGGPAAGVASPVPDPAGGLLLDLEFTGGLLYVVRQSVAAHAAAAGMSEARVRDVVIVVHELAANAVRHGAGRGRLRMWSEGGAVRCQVEDGGREPCPAGDGAAAGWPEAEGHGLWLARRAADELTVTCGPGGTCATVVFAVG